MAITTMTNRIEHFDILRGIAILGVISLHAIDFGSNPGASGFEFYFLLAWKQAANFSVPLFLAISGCLLVKNFDAENYNHIGRLKRQLEKVYAPFLFWSIVWLAISVVFWGKPLKTEIIRLLAFQSSGPYYFIALIIQYYAAFPLVVKCTNQWGVQPFVAISLIAAAIINYVRFFLGVDVPLIVYAGNGLTWLCFFSLGIYIGQGKKIYIPARELAIATLIFYLLSCCETLAIFKATNNLGGAMSSVKISSFLYSLCVIGLILPSTSKIKGGKILANIGSRSFGIFLIHMFFLFAFDALIGRSPMELKSNFSAVLPVLIVAVCASCVAFIGLARKLIPPKYTSKIGFNQ